MRTNILFIAAILITINNSLIGQIKIHDDNHISIGSLTKGGGLQMQPEGYLYHQPTYTASWEWYSQTYALNPYSQMYMVRYNSTTKYCVLGTGQVYSNGSYYFSDIKLKENIEEIESPLEKLISLNGIRFDFKREYQDTITYVDDNGELQTIIPPDPYEDDLLDNENVTKEAKPLIIAERSRKHFGFIAQEVEEVFPDVVRTTPEGKKALAYHELLAICVEAIKEINQKASLTSELQSNIDQLNKTINELQIQIAMVNQSNIIEKSSNANYENDNSFNDEIKLFQNRPNPYTTQTVIKCRIPQTINTASLVIYDLNGTQLKSIELMERGEVEKTISASELRPGMYLYSLLADNRLIDTKTMILTSR